MSEKVYCKYCGRTAFSVSLLTGMSCKKNPEGNKHVPYEGSEKPKYECKYCGRSGFSISSLTGMSCKNSPSGYHIPL